MSNIQMREKICQEKEIGHSYSYHYVLLIMNKNKKNIVHYQFQVKDTLF